MAQPTTNDTPQDRRAMHQYEAMAEREATLCYSCMQYGCMGDC